MSKSLAKLCRELHRRYELAYGQLEPEQQVAVLAPPKLPASLPGFDDHTHWCLHNLWGLGILTDDRWTFDAKQFPLATAHWNAARSMLVAAIASDGRRRPDDYWLKKELSDTNWIALSPMSKLAVMLCQSQCPANLWEAQLGSNEDIAFIGVAMALFNTAEVVDDGTVGHMTLYLSAADLLHRIMASAEDAGIDH